MKFDVNKFALAAATTSTVFMIVAKLVWRLFLCKQLSLLGLMPGGGMIKGMAGKLAPKGMDMCGMIGWHHMLLGIAASFIMTFAMAWFFAWFYNMLVCGCDKK